MIIVMLNDKHLFDWEGDETDVQEILKKFPHEAEGKNMSPDAFADMTIQWLARGLYEATDPVATTAVMWRILTAESHDAERPGLIGDYVPDGTLTFAACIDTIGAFSHRLEVAVGLHPEPTEAER